MRYLQNGPCNVATGKEAGSFKSGTRKPDRRASRLYVVTRGVFALNLKGSQLMETRAFDWLANDKTDELRRVIVVVVCIAGPIYRFGL